MIRRWPIRRISFLVSIAGLSWLAVCRLHLVDDVVDVEDGPYCHMALRRHHMNVTGWQSDQCHLHRYTQAEVAECFHSLSQHRNRETRREHALHFAFVGDSRTRLQFFSFLQLIPDHDRNWWSQCDNPFDRTRTLHFPIYVDSRMLNVQISYNWMPVFDGWTKELFARWDQAPYTATPDYILFGLTAHHMVTLNGNDVKAFEGNLTELVSKVKIFANISNFIWLNQYPTIDFWGRSGSFNADVNWQKMFHYDRKSREILKDSGAIFWDSSHPTIEEYIRSCQLADHYDNQRFRDCSDYIHAGFLATDHATHFLYNFLCNRLLSQSDSPSVQFEPGTCCT